MEVYAERVMPVERVRPEADRDAIRHDRELVKRMLAGEEAAFDEFADVYAKALYRYAMSRLGGERELSGEVVQASLCKALSNIESYRGAATLFTWLCSICRNEILMHFRRRKSAPVESELDENVTPIESWGRRPKRPDELFLADESAELVKITLDLLPRHYSDALEWKYVEKISVKEIGERLRVGAKAAESILTRAREAFRKSYKSVGEALVRGDGAVGGSTGGNR